MKLIINPYNLKNNDTEEYNIKARAILINDNNELLVANYGGIYLLPGGSINYNEDIQSGLIRELKEETGTEYETYELEYLCHLDYFQKNYPKINGTTKNRLITTYYYIGTYKVTSPDNQILTEKEQKGNFKLELIPLEQLHNIIISNKNNNPRHIYFQNELLKVLKFYKESIHNAEQKKNTNIKIKCIIS